MNGYGLVNYSVEKAAVQPIDASALDSRTNGDSTFRSVFGRGFINEPFTGAWQRNCELRQEDILSHPTVFACITMIANDISKMKIKLCRENDDGIFVAAQHPASTVLAKPNSYQTRIQFINHWIVSKAATGNAYILKQRDVNDRIIALYVLHPDRVTPMIADDGQIYYSLSGDRLNRIEDQIVVPAREIIHDRMNCLYHALVGVTPLHASGLSAQMGVNISNQSAGFFENHSMPSGVLMLPQEITREKGKEAKDYWRQQYSGPNAGNVAVLGGGMEYKPIQHKATDAQLIEQSNLAKEDVCQTYHMPLYKVGVGQPPAYNNIEILQQNYLDDCLQIYIEELELALKEGLGLPDDVEVQFNLKDLVRMNRSARMKINNDSVRAAVMSPNEARKDDNLPPVKGGESPIAQHQDYPLEILANRTLEEPPVQQAEELDDEDVKSIIAGVRANLESALQDG